MGVTFPISKAKKGANQNIKANSITKEKGIPKKNPYQAPYNSKSAESNADRYSSAAKAEEKLLLDIANNFVNCDDKSLLNFDDKESKSVVFPNYKQNVKEEHKFYVHDGKELRNLLELGLAIRHMRDETFAHHVNESKNDFATWIKDCMGETQLANELMKYKTKTSNELLVLRHIAGQLKE